MKDVVDLSGLSDSGTWNKATKQAILKQIKDLTDEVKNLKTVNDLTSVKDSKTSPSSSGTKNRGQCQNQQQSVDREYGYKLDPNTPVFDGSISENVEK